MPVCLPGVRQRSASASAWALQPRCLPRAWASRSPPDAERWSLPVRALPLRPVVSVLVAVLGVVVIARTVAAGVGGGLGLLLGGLLVLGGVLRFYLAAR